MLAFEVKDMSCGHCVSTITRAVQAVDPQAQVQVDLGRQRVQVAPHSADAATLADAIRGAGYHPTPLAPVPTPEPAAAGPRRSGGCCGGCGCH